MLTLSPAQGATSNGLPTFTVGSYESGATIELYHSADCSGTAIFTNVTDNVSQSDFTSFSASSLSEGVNHFSVKQIDSFTNKSICSATGVSDSTSIYL